MLACLLARSNQVGRQWVAQFWINRERSPKLRECDGTNTCCVCAGTRRVRYSAWDPVLLNPSPLIPEAGHADYWYKYVGLDGKVVGMKTFGESAPGEEVMDHFGFTVQGVVDAE